MELPSNKPSPFSSQPRTPHKAPEASPKEGPKKPGFFGEKGVKRSELREKFRKDPGKIPGTVRHLSKQERIAIEKKIPKRLGDTITRQDVRRSIDKFRKDIRYKKSWDPKRKETEDIIKILEKKLK